MIKPPPLRNDCFALPPGVDWVPVDEALAFLKQAVSVVTPVETRPLAEAAGLFLAEPVRAPRSHPPYANSAVDGYAFAHRGAGEQVFPLAEGRSAAGAPYTGRVPAGQALRILTGAAVPEGVDTVVLEEDVSVEAGQIAFHGDLKRGANTRAAGEDVQAGADVLPAGQRLRPQDLSLLAAVGVQEVPVRRRLRVGVLSTGDEVVERDAAPHQIYDANRPMLLAQAEAWGYRGVDLGHVPDDRAALAARLDQAAAEVDVVLTTGGASAGDEDHVSALLSEAGSLEMWRIAIKPGRPLALGLWKGCPIFGLPGNPVAAFVCTLVFAAPAFRVLAGGTWREPLGFPVPAGFSKRKKQGRREFLRARLTPEGTVEVFGSEGSGRISGLAWAEGLVELGDGGFDVAEGDIVRFLPLAEFSI